jgi:hypothetical protein
MLKPDVCLPTPAKPFAVSLFAVVLSSLDKRQGAASHPSLCHDIVTRATEHRIHLAQLIHASTSIPIVMTTKDNKLPWVIAHCAAYVPLCWNYVPGTASRSTFGVIYTKQRNYKHYLCRARVLQSHDSSNA